MTEDARATQARDVWFHLQFQIRHHTYPAVGDYVYLDRSGSIEAILAYGDQCRDEGRAEHEAEAAYQYLARLFCAVAPQSKPLPNLLGLSTQIDNYVAGLRQRVTALEQALEKIARHDGGRWLSDGDGYPEVRQDSPQEMALAALSGAAETEEDNYAQ